MGFKESNASVLFGSLCNRPKLENKDCNGKRNDVFSETVNYTAHMQGLQLTAWLVYRLVYLNIE